VVLAVIRKMGFEVLDNYSIDEVNICAKVLGIRNRPGVMIDVGAHIGSTARQFCEAGWRVYAFEPDPVNREQLVKNLGRLDGLTIDERALSNEEIDSVTFYQSPQSTGISGLSSFHESHVAAGTVPVTTLKNVIGEYDIGAIDFLKIDTEGFDKFVLMGLPWETHSPTLIVCEFEDFKTRPLGYNVTDLIRYLENRGYEVLISEWKPIEAYGARHEWSDFKRSACKIDLEKSWGNLIASRDARIFQRVINECERIKRRLGKHNVQDGK